MLELITSGIHSSLQDLGRTTYRRFGVPVGGAMDKNSAINTNRLLGNSDDALLLEMMHNGPQLRVKHHCQLAIQGSMRAKLDGEYVGYGSVFNAQAGSILSFEPDSKGVFAYLGVRGGFQAEVLLGSATIIPGTDGSGRLLKGDKLGIFRGNKKPDRQADLAIGQTEYGSVIESYKGPEFDQYSEIIEDVFERNWTLSSHCNRMSYQLNETVAKTASGIITSAVQAGTVQLTPSGKLVILMRDCQTTGGYARVLQLSDQAINVLAQQRPGTTIQFSLLG